MQLRSIKLTPIKPLLPRRQLLTQRIRQYRKVHEIDQTRFLNIINGATSSVMKKVSPWLLETRKQAWRKSEMY
jgi:hypothetical protein